MSAQPTTRLRFASLTRVSTDAQEEEGQSLQTQLDQNVKNVALLGGTITARYGDAAEHATPGWERKEMNRLIADAPRGIFDAVIIANVDRWDRGSDAGRRAFEVFKEHGIRFFVSCTEYCFDNPEHVLFLDLAGVIGKYQAANAKKKSVLNRIARAREGRPTAGKLPYARTYDPIKGWGLDPVKVQKVERAARLYLEGKSLIEMAKEVGLAMSFLHDVLNNLSGDTWKQTFNVPSQKIHEVVTFTVPRLLPEETLRQIRERSECRRTYNRKTGTPRQHLLARVIRCGHCGICLYPHVWKGSVYYRHTRPRRIKDCRCPDPTAAVRADDVEEAVLLHLFDLFGNPAAVQRAVEKAVPDLDKVEESRQRLTGLEAELKRIEVRQDRVLDQIADGLLTKEAIERKATKLRDEERSVRGEIGQIKAALANVPTREEVEQVAQKVVRAFRLHVDLRRQYEIQTINADLAGMSFADKRKLIELVLCGKTPAGERMGVYVTRGDDQHGKAHQTWTLKLVGRLVDGFLWSPTALADEYENHAPLQDVLLEETGETFARPTAGRRPGARPPPGSRCVAPARRGPAGGPAGGAAAAGPPPPRGSRPGPACGR
jgi:DNA invertase Pin-like site-specific DNA recombinase